MRPAAPLAISFVVGMLAGCGSIRPADAPATPFEGLPGPAYLHLDGEPRAAARPFVVTFAGPDGDRSGQSFAFEAGQRVVIDRTSFAETVAAWVDDIACDGTATTLTDRETDGFLEIDDDACRVTTTRNHAVADDVHPELTGGLSAEAPLGSTLTLTTLADAVPGELADDADESGWISLELVPAGRWRVVLTKSGQQLDEQTITIEAGEHQHLDLTP
jgi:hypothetical protein